jgi:hypothetical protein
MALDPGFPSAAAQQAIEKNKKKKRSPVVSGEQATGGSKVPAASIRTGEDFRQPYLGSTNPAFARVGFSGDIFSLNRRVETANAAFTSRFGFEPSPGLLLDLVRAPVSTDEYHDLIHGLPTTMQRAEASLALQRHQADIEEAARLEQPEGLQRADIDPNAPELVGLELQKKIQTMGPDDFNINLPSQVGATLGVVPTAVFQIAESLYNTPAGLVALGQAGYGDTKALAGGDPTFSKTREIAKAIGGQVVEDFRHPLENPGYLALDVFGAISAGGGIAARGSAISKASRATNAVRAGAEIPDLLFTENLRPQTLNRVALGQRGRAVWSAAVRRPLPGVFEIGPPGAEIYVPLRENAALRAIQRRYYTTLNNRLLKNLNEEPKPSYSRVGDLQRTRQSLFSAETTYGRHVRARVREERKTLYAPIRQFEEITRATDHVADVFKRLPIVNRGIKSGPGTYGLTVGDQMAIMLHATGGPDPVGLWRGFHENWRDWAIEDANVARAELDAADNIPDVETTKADAVAAATDRLRAAQTLIDNHEAKLVQLELGVEAFKNPSGRLLRAIEASREISHAQETLKMRFLGLPADIAANRIAVEREILDLTKSSASKEEFLSKVDEVLGGPKLANEYSDSFYYPQLLPKDVEFRTPNYMGASRSSGMFGHPHPEPLRYLPELKHRYEGKAIMAGNTVVDASQLARKYGVAARAVTTMEDYRRLVDLSVETPNHAPTWERGFMRPIRTIEGVPDQLRELLQPFFEDRTITAEEIAQVMKSELVKGDDIAKLHEYIFPEYEVVNGVPRLKTGEPIEGVRWVDERLATDLHRFPGEPGFDAKIFRIINDPVRAGILYLRLGYLNNLFSNVGMLAIQQGFASPVNMAKSLLAGKIYSRKAITHMDALISEGRSLSYAPEDIKLLKGTRSLSHFWDRVIDRWMRRAALIWELERQGYKTSDAIERLLDPTNRDKKTVAKRVEISQRANKAMVQFDNLTWFEKKHLRHWIFVYPWVSRASIWAARTMMDHPLKTWALSELGQVGEDYITDTFEDILGKVPKLPDWFKHGGYVPIGDVDGSGNPRVLNFNSANSFATFAENYRNFKGLFDDDPIHGIESMLGPGAEVFLRLATKKNQYGEPYKNGVIGGIADVYGGIPFAKGLAGPKDRSQPINPDTGEPEAVRSSYQNLKPGETVSPEHRAVITPDYLAGGSMFDPLIASGIWRPQSLDVEAAEERYWQEQSKEDRAARRNEIYHQQLAEKIKTQIASMREAEQITSKVLGRPVPAAVNEAISLQSSFQQAYLRYSINNKLGRMPTSAEQTGIMIDVLRSKGKITPDTATDLHEKLDKAVTYATVPEFRQEISDTYLNRKELLRWHKERDIVLNTVANISDQVDYLKANGFYSGSLPTEGRIFPKHGLIEDVPARMLTKKEAPGLQPLGGVSGEIPRGPGINLDSPIYELGRRLVDYETGLKAYEPADTTDLSGVTISEYRAWQDSQDKPVEVDGHKYPSPVRLKWADDIIANTLDDPNYEAKKMAALSVQSWDTLTDFEKEVVGRKQTFTAKGKAYKPSASYGWMVYNAIADALRGKVTRADVPGEIKTLIPTEPLENRIVTAEERSRIASFVDKFVVGGFYKDFQFQEKAKIERVKTLPIITQSKYKKLWETEVLQGASATQNYINDLRRQEKTGILDAQNDYKDWVRHVLWPWVQKQPKAFQREVNFLGGEDFLRTLVD